MVKSYIKYEQSNVFGAIASASANVVWAPEDTHQQNAVRNTGVGRAFVGANEEVLCWDVKKGELLSKWRDEDCVAAVTAICRSPADPDVFAVGYGDGSIKLWDSRIATLIVNFNGHRSAITELIFDRQGVRLASGSKDTDIIVWDLVAETGLFKLRGHTNQITGLHFLRALSSKPENGGESQIDDLATAATTPELTEGFLLSTGKDAKIKVWDINSQYCVETHITQSNGECWALAVSFDENGCVTGGNDGEAKVWIINREGLRDLATHLQRHDSTNILFERGTINRQGKDHTTGISFHPTADYVAMHGSDKSVELFRIRPHEEVEKTLARRRKRKREKTAGSGGKSVQSDADTFDALDGGENTPNATVKDIFEPYVIVRTGGRVRSITWVQGRTSQGLQLLVGTTNNQIDIFGISKQDTSKKSKKSTEPEYSRTYSVDLPGHRTDVRAISLSSDDRMLASASSGNLKVWNIKTQSCLRTLECGYALCCSFLPGDKIVVVGTKGGELELFDIASSALIDTVQAHEGAIWTLSVHPDGRSLVSGSADKSAKFWNFEIAQEEILGTKRTTSRLKLVHTRTLKVNDDVLNICFSPDSRLLAVATLDNTVKVFFVDSLKLFLNLYGHRLPVLNMSISSDSKLIATCSADKNVRLWGLDFGDCHKAFFAHDESIMQVGFIPYPEDREDAHIFFSASKDHMVKSWDGDKFQQIQRLKGHHGEIWAMTVSRTGDFVVTASHDKSLRVWAKTDEPLFLEEERERELEEMYDQNLAANLDRDQDDDYAAREAGGGDSAEVVPASKQTAATLTASERISEALVICTEDLEAKRDYDLQAQRRVAGKPATRQRHPLLAFRNVSAEAYLLSIFAAIPSPALHDALLLLHFSALPGLFVFLSIWLEKEMNVPLTCRILFFLLKTHHKQIVASRELRGELEGMREKLRSCLERWKGIMGFNMAAAKILGGRARGAMQRSVEDHQDGIAGGGTKRGFVNVA